MVPCEGYVPCDPGRCDRRRFDGASYDMDMVSKCEVETLIYEHGTRFVFPQSMLTAMLPIGSGLLIRLMFKAGRQYLKGFG